MKKRSNIVKNISYHNPSLDIRSTFLHKTLYSFDGFILFKKRDFYILTVNEINRYLSNSPAHMDLGFVSFCRRVKEIEY